MVIMERKTFPDFFNIFFTVEVRDVYSSMTW